jgi:hypothetical protein
MRQPDQHLRLAWLLHCHLIQMLAPRQVQLHHCDPSSLHLTLS